MDSIFTSLLQANQSLANITLIYVFLNFALGLFLGLYGKKWFYIWMGLVAFVFGYTSSSALGADVLNAIFTGFIAAILSIFFYLLGIFLIGAALGFVASFFVGDINILIIIGFTLFGGAIAIALNDLVLILSSALAGAALVTNGTFSIVSLITGNETGLITSSEFIPYLFDTAQAYSDPNAILSVAVFYIYEIIVLFIIFCIYQIALFRKKPEKNRNKLFLLIRDKLADITNEKPKLQNVLYLIIPPLNPNYEEIKKAKKEKEAEKLSNEISSLKNEFSKVFKFNKKK
ncbi:TMEM198/TM7SF3 family protein [Gammaproteobacteria bacterium]|nr:TMEM198/TM7SF3 family protein [Gammaproteobacteria bacterium]